MIPTIGKAEYGQILAELEVWFNKPVLLVVESIKQLTNLLFNMIFSTGLLGSIMKMIVQLLCSIVQIILKVWNETGA